MGGLSVCGGAFGLYSAAEACYDIVDENVANPSVRAPRRLIDALFRTGRGGHLVKKQEEDHEP